MAVRWWWRAELLHQNVTPTGVVSMLQEIAASTRGATQNAGDAAAQVLSDIEPKSAAGAADGAGGAGSIGI